MLRKRCAAAKIDPWAARASSLHPLLTPLRRMSVETKRISAMAWQSYRPLLVKIAAGHATKATYAQLDKLILEDYEDHREARGGRHPQMLITLLLTIAAHVISAGKEDLLADTAEGIVRNVLAMSFVEKDMPAVVAPFSDAEVIAAAKPLRKDVLGWLDRRHGGEMYHFALAEFADAIVPAVRARHAAFRAKIQARCDTLRPELMAAAWAPARVERWMEAGIELESL